MPGPLGKLNKSISASAVAYFSDSFASVAVEQTASVVFAAVAGFVASV